MIKLFFFPFVFQRCKKVQFLITIGDGKFYSNGLDQTFLKTCSTEEFIETFNLLNKTLIRFMTFPVLTVAAINGIVQLFHLKFCVKLSMTTRVPINVVLREKQLKNLLGN